MLERLGSRPQLHPRIDATASPAQPLAVDQRRAGRRPRHARGLMQSQCPREAVIERGLVSEQAPAAPGNRCDDRELLVEAVRLQVAAHAGRDGAASPHVGLHQVRRGRAAHQRLTAQRADPAGRLQVADRLGGAAEAEFEQPEGAGEIVRIAQLELVAEALAVGDVAPTGFLLSPYGLDQGQDARREVGEEGAVASGRPAAC
jgi:hypothetical protein